MSLTFYVGDYGPIPATVTEDDGVTPSTATPLSATATIVNLHTGEAVIEDGTCLVEPGTAAYIIPSGSIVTATASRYVAYLSVIIDSTTKQTAQVPFDVLDKSAYLTVDRWRRKVEFAAPSLEAISDEEGRDWIDQAVDHLSRHYAFEYDSVLGLLDPAPDRPTIEYVASVGALMARTAWWAGKGNWRDEEMSLDTGPFFAEWKQLRETLAVGQAANWYTEDGPYDQWTMYNRDKVDVFGIADKPDTYYDQTWIGEE